MMAAAFPPSSRTMCLLGTARWIAKPTVSEPVNEMTGRRGSSASDGATSLPTGMTENMPAGRSVSARSSPSSRAPSGVAGAGFTTIGAPTARAGAILCATRFTGKLNGEMPRTGPCGKRLMIAARPAVAVSVSSRWNSPLNLRASSAAQRKVEAALVASARDQVIGLPFSAVMRAATSSTRSSSRRETWVSAAARCAAVVACACFRTCQAPSIAASTLAASGIVYVPTTDPSPGWVTSARVPLSEAVPAINAGQWRTI